MTSRPTVAIDIRLASYRRGGIPRYDEELSRHLPAAAPDLDLTFLVGRHSSGPATTARKRGVHTPAHFRFERLTMGLELRRGKPDLLHSTDFVSPRLRTRRVVTIHDLAFLQWPELLAPDARRYYAQTRRSAATAERVIAVSHYTAGQVRDRLGVPESRISVVYNGVNLPDDGQGADHAAVVIAELGQDVLDFVGGDTPVVLAVGTVEPRKHLDLLLDVLSSSSSGDMSLVVVGQQGWRAELTVDRLRTAVEHRRALWLQDVSDTALDALYHLATVLALPSFDEGFGLTALEAMAAGLPVVAAGAGAVPEVVGDAGVLVTDQDPGAWAGVLRAVVDDPERRQQLSALGRERAGRFTWAETARQTARVYREVLG